MLDRRRRRKILLVGQAPGRGDPSLPCLGKFMRTLVSAASMSEAWYAASFERVNLLPKWPGRRGKGDDFPMAEARRCAAALDITGRVVILCGRRVAEAFGVRCDMLGSVQHRGAVVWLMPHPSGLNRWWNSKKNRLAAGWLLRELTR